MLHSHANSDVFNTLEEISNHKCVMSNIYDKCDDFDIGIVNFPFFDDDVPRRASYLLTVYTFRNLLALLESAIMLRTLTREINV